MSDIDPDTLLEWLQTGNQDVTLLALEQLCTILLLSDNIDRCFESYPPRSFLPALCKIFLDELATDQVLEATARALTYYLDVSQECTRRIVSVEGTLRAICNRLLVIEVDNKISKDLAEQCIKTLELICARESSAVFEAGGLNCILPFILEHGKVIYKDSLHSAMSVVTRLCAKMDPTDPNLDFCVETLSKLLKHEDNLVADGALRCFASLSDRFTRKGVDPAPLAKHGLINELIRKLGDSVLINTNSNQNQNQTLNKLPQAQTVQQSQQNQADSSKSIVSISTLTSLLSTLCRSSDSITKEILESNILDSIEKALYGDERCVLDTIRFLDLLLTLIFEGRQALPKSSNNLLLLNSKSQVLTKPSSNQAKKSDQIDKLQRQLIEWIRIKDTDSLIESLEANQIDLNFMDDVGQTLLNWASAFGTAEMVEYLCSKGADVNKGLRSSSLHYAACFGRVQIVRTLLRYGANPDLRDEEGKTALDKARERGEESHREVVQILQHTPCDLFIEEDKNEPNETSIPNDSTSNDLIEIKFNYTKRLIPILCKLNLSCIIQSINKSCLNLLKKLISYSNGEQLSTILKLNISDGDEFLISSQLVELINKLLQDEMNYEHVLIGLSLSKDLFKKCENFMLEEFARLGVSSLIVQIARMKLEKDEDEEESETGDELQAVSLKPEMVYFWSSFVFLTTKEFVYIYNEFIAIELSLTSNGWFRFLINNKIYSMYSNGRPEQLSEEDNEENKKMFLNRFIHAKNLLLNDLNLMKSEKISKTLGLENWDYEPEENILLIKNKFSNQKLIIKSSINIVEFESNQNEHFSYLGSENLGADFQPPKRSPAKLNKLHHFLSINLNKTNKINQKEVKKNCIELAQKLNELYLSNLQNKPRSLVVKLNHVVEELNACLSIDKEWQEIYLNCLNELKLVLNETNKPISSYELSESGLIQVLLDCLSNEVEAEKLNKRRSIFYEIFSDSDIVLNLLSKLVGVFESNEKLPIYLYDSPGSYNLQSFSKRFKLILSKANKNDQNILDYSGRVLKVEPLANITHLEKYITKMVQKQWYDYERPSFNYLNLIEKSLPFEFKYKHDFDDNGLLYWIGTNGKSNAEWVNPASHNSLIKMSLSDSIKQLASGKHEDLIGRQASNCHTNSDEKRVWFVIDLGMHIIPSHYTLRYSKGFNKTAPRNWALLGSKTGGSSSSDWDILCQHSNDDRLKDFGQSTTWILEEQNVIKQEKIGWRFLRIQQTGRNQSGANYTLSMSGFEVYGKVTSIVYDDLLSVSLSSSTTRLSSDSDKRKQKRSSSSRLSSLQKQMILGARVVRGTDWKWANQDKVSEECRPNEGTVITELNNGWVEVIWDNGFYNYYRMGYDSKFDLQLASTHDLNKLNTYHAIALQNLAMSKANSNFGLVNNLKNEMNNNLNQQNENFPRKENPNLALNKIKFKLEPDNKIAFTSLDNSLNTVNSVANLEEQLGCCNNNLNNQNLKKLVHQTDLSKVENDENNTDSFKFTTNSKNVFNSQSKINILNKNRKSSSTPVLTTTESLNQLLDANQTEFLSLNEDKQTLELNQSTQTISSNSCTEVFNNNLNESCNSSNTLATSSNLDLNTDDAPDSSSFRAYFSTSNSHSLLEPKKFQRHLSLQNTHDKSQSANNLLSFVNQMQLTAVSEPNVLNQLDENKTNSSCSATQISNKRLSTGMGVLVPAGSGSTSSSYFPLEPTMEECLESLDISYETTTSANDFLNQLQKQEENLNQDKSQKSSTEDLFSKNLCTLINKTDFKQIQNENSQEQEESNFDSSSNQQDLDLFSNLFSKENTQDIELLLNTFGLFSSNNSKKSNFNSLIKSLSSIKSLDNSEDGSELWNAILTRLESDTNMKNKVEKTVLLKEMVDEEEEDETNNDVEEEEEDEFMRVGEHIPNEPNENEDFEDEFLDDEELDFANQKQGLESGLKRMRELKRRHQQTRFGKSQTESSQDQTRPNSSHHNYHHHHHDEFVLKCQFSALIPAFDPRPGKNNINQIQDISVPSNLSTINQPCINQPELKSQTKIDLYLKVDLNSNNNLLNRKLDFVTDEIKLTNKNSTIFQYVQNLIRINSKKDGLTLNYDKMKSIWDMNYYLIYRESDSAESDSDSDNLINTWSNVEDILKLLTILKTLFQIDLDLKKDFLSDKINNKLIQQLQDPLVLASRSLPDWCKHLLNTYKFLFPFETRQLYFITTAFGVSRSIVWLQNKRDALLNTLRGPTTNRVLRDDHEFRIGRLKHERIKIPREPASDLIRSAINALKFHANRKAVLEIEFMDEEGTGLGPTLEFFSLIAGELQRKKFALWYCEDNETRENDLESYVHEKNGLFPAAYPVDLLLNSDNHKPVLEFYNFMGIFIAKSLQDQRLVDIPLSKAFLKILCSSKTDLNDLLDLDDLLLIDPFRGSLLKKLSLLIETRNKNEEFLIEINGSEFKLKDLGLVFEYNPPSKVYAYEKHELKPNGSDILVDETNVEEYVELMKKFLLKEGIEKQLEAFKEGFDSVFNMESLKCFEPYEFQLLLSGEQAPSWTYEEVMNYTEPKLGYSKDSVGFHRFVNVMCNMNADERKLFVQFLTGCSSLPPGGLANLHPRLTVVKKDGTDSSYPSVNTCVHYLKLPEYSNEDVLKEQLMIACQEKGFYLN